MTAPAGSEDAGLVLSGVAAARVGTARAEGAKAALLYAADRFAYDGTGDRDHLLRVARWLRESADAIAERIAAALEFEASQSTVGPAYLAAARIARTPDPKR